MSHRHSAAVLFTDLVGSTELLHRLGEDRADEVRQHHFSLLRAPIHAHRGREVKNLGDGLMVVFLSAQDALRCGIEMQQRVGEAMIGELDAPLGLRVGVSTGDVLADDDGDVFGTTVVVAKRLCDRAASGEILATELAGSSIDARSPTGLIDRGALLLKGLIDPVRAYAVLWSVGEPRVTDEPDCARTPITVGSDLEGGLPLPSAVASEIQFRLAGRDEQLVELAKLFEEARQGSTRVVFIGGEPGVGKTRLACEVAVQAQEAGTLVLFGRNDEESLLPLQPFVEAARQALGQVSPIDRAALLPESEARHLRRLLPELDAVGSAEGAMGDGDNERHRLFAAFVGLFERLAQRWPLLLVLDDLQWADKPTVLLMKQLARVTDSRLLVIGTFRDSELGRDGAFAQALATFHRAGNVRQIRLAGLDRAGVAGLVADWAGQPATAAVAEAIWSETEGHPFFVREVLRHLRETGALFSPDGTLVSRLSLDEIGVPDGVGELVGRRCALLSEQSRRLLTIAAVVGREFAILTVAGAAEMTEDEVIDGVEEAAAAGLVDEMPAKLSHFRFAHGLVRETLCGALSAARLARLHERIGDAIEGGAANDKSALSELSHHYFEAAARSNVLGKAIEYALAAAAHAETQLAYEEAAAQLDRAVRGLALQDSGSPRHCRSLLSLGINRWRSGDYAEARNAFRLAAEMADQLSLADVMAEAALGYAGQIGFEFGIINPTMVGFLERSLEQLGADRPDLRALLLGRLAEAIVVSGDLDRARSLAEGAVELARSVQDPMVLGRVLSHSILPCGSPDRLGERLAVGDEVLELAALTGNPRLELEGHIYRGTALLEQAEIAATLEEVRACERLADDRREPYYQWLVDTLHAAVAIAVGDAASAERATWQALETGRRSENSSALILWGVQMLYVRRFQQRLPELRVGTKDMAAHFEKLPALRAGYAMLLVEIGRHDDASRELEALALHDFAGIPRDLFWLITMFNLAEVAVGVGDKSAAAALYRHLEPYAGRVVVAGIFAAPLGLVDHALGTLAATLGRCDDAAAHLRTAIEVSAAAGLGAAALFAQIDLAQVLHNKGGAMLEVRALVEAAQADAARLGVVAAQHRLDNLTDPVAVNSAAAPRTRRLRAALSLRGRSALARLISDMSDADLDKRFGSSLAQRTLFTSMTSSFQPALAYGFDGEILVELGGGDRDSGQPDVWTITITGDGAVARHTSAEHPAATIRAATADFIRLVAGSANAVDAWLDGRVSVEGDIIVCTRLVEMFGGVHPDDVAPTTTAARA